MTTSARTGRGSKALPWIIGILALVIVAVVAGRPGSGSNGGDPSDSGWNDGIPYDPESTGSTGARALVLLLESFGADVDTTSNLPGPDTDVAFMFSDVIAEGDQAQVDDWVEDGGVLVVADPYSSWTNPLASGGPADFGLQAEVFETGDCDIDSLRDLEGVETGGFAETFEAPVDARRCFTDSDLGTLPGAFVVEQELGRGRIVSVGSPAPFVNELLDERDNAALATGLLLDPAVGGVGGGDVVEISLLQYGGAAVDNDQSLSDSMGTGAKIALVQLGVAFLVYAWHRARRVGRPIVEPQPVSLAGSELVSAVGQLLQQSDDPDRSARALRADLRRRLGERFGLGPTAPPEVIAAVVAERTGSDRDHLLSLLGTRPVTTDRELVQLASDIDDLRKEILHGP